MAVGMFVQIAATPYAPLTLTGSVAMVNRI